MMFVWLVASLVLIHTIQASFLDSPSQEWSYQAPTGTFGKDNAVVATDSLVYATTSDGSLHIVRPDALNNSIVVKAPVKEGFTTVCRSGVSVGPSFAVYAVLFDNTTTRIVAVKPNGALLWTVNLPGSASGTPQLGLGGAVYVTHNILLPDGSVEGRIVVLDDAGTLLGNFTSGGMEPFGPVTVQRGDDGLDYAFWGEQSQNGYATPATGNIYALVPSSNDGGPFQLTVVGQWRYSLVTPPTVAAGLNGLWVGGTRSTVSGWVNGRRPAVNFDAPTTSSWEEPLEPNVNDPDQPLLGSVALSSDQQFIYVADAYFTLVCMEAATGSIEWFNDGDRTGGYRVAPKLNEPNGETPRVYIIEYERGTVRQHDATTGTLEWQWDCQDSTGTSSCTNHVEAEFSLSPAGNILYYGDVTGKLTALRIADFDTPAPSQPANTNVPTAAPVVAATDRPATNSPVTLTPVENTRPPTTDAPTIGLQPTETGTTQGVAAGVADSNKDTNDGSILVYSLIGAVAACSILAISFVLLFVRKRRRQRKAQEEAVVLGKRRESRQKFKQEQDKLEQEARQQELQMTQAAASGVPRTPSTKGSNSNDVTPSTIPDTPEIVHSRDDDGHTTISALSHWSDPESTEAMVDPSLEAKAIEAKFRSIKAKDEEKKNDEDASVASYLPRMLANTFDHVAVSLGYSSEPLDEAREIRPAQSVDEEGAIITPVRAASLYTHAATPPVSPPSENRYKSPFDWDRDDQSSIGSGSLFVDDGTLKAARSFSPTSDGENEPGPISSSAPKMEQEDDPWSNLMSTLIQAEKDFFDPRYSSSKPTASAETTPARQQSAETSKKAGVLPFDEPFFDETGRLSPPPPPPPLSPPDSPNY